MATFHMTEAEVVRDIAEVLTRVRQGSEIVIEQDHRPIAVIKPSLVAGRMISAVLADLNDRQSTAVMGEDFAHDVEAGIKAQQQPWQPPSWE